MTNFLTLIKSDYLQRTRSYTFLITLCVTLAFAYSFVPGPDANYSTIRMGDYVGEYNSAWIGYVTAIMTSSFVALIGFYLVNSGIKKDIQSKVGTIIATTRVRNLTYLLSKTLSNFLVLLTIVFMVFLMSIGLFFLYNVGHSFNISAFILPFLLIPIPTIFFVSVLAVVFEVIFSRFSIVQNIAYFFLFAFLATSNLWSFENGALDVFGVTEAMEQMELAMEKSTGETFENGFQIGFNTVKNENSKTFLFEGGEFSSLYILSRFLWMVFGLLLIVCIAPFFHRFNTRERVSIKKKSAAIEHHGENDIELSSLPKVTAALGMYAFFKTELLLLFRKDPRWLWFVNVGGMVALLLAPLEIAHQFVLPVVWFLQVSRWSSLTTKEGEHNMHYFAFASFKPLTRLLLSQLLAGISIGLFLAIPLIIRYGIALDFTAILSIVLGGCFIVLLAAALGIVTQGKKLFEVLFFMLTYANLNGVPFLDYFGGFMHENFYLLKLVLFVAGLAGVTFLVRKNQLRN